MDKTYPHLQVSPTGLDSARPLLGSELDAGAEARQREPWAGADADGSRAQARHQHWTDLYVAASAAERAGGQAAPGAQFCSAELTPFVCSGAIRSRSVPSSLAPAAGLIEIVLPGGVLVRVDAHVDARVLRRVLGALSER
jgi:hypothetical protein